MPCMTEQTVVTGTKKKHMHCTVHLISKENDTRAQIGIMLKTKSITDF